MGVRQVFCSASESSLRDSMPSLAKTLPRCHSTVRGLRNSSAPISGLVRPSAASRATWASCAVKFSRAPNARLAYRHSGGDQFTAGSFGECVRAHVGEHVVGRGQLAAGIETAVLPPQPLAVQQVGAGELDAHASQAEPLDGLDVELLGRVTLCSPVREHRASIPRAHSVPLALVVRASKLECICGAVGVATSHRGLDELHQGPRGEAELVRVSGSSLCCRQGFLVLTQAVVENSRGVVDDGEPHAFTSLRGPRKGGSDELGGDVLPAPPRRERQGAVRQQVIVHDLVDRLRTRRPARLPPRARPRRSAGPCGC